MRIDKELPLITYITVVYNRENTIEKCINSVISQDYPNIEYIIVDGCSTDDTMKIVNRFSDRIDHIVSEKDSGIYNAMNKGLKYASGDLICFMNSDDECIPGAARTVADIYIQNEVDIITGIRVLKQNGKEIPEQTFSRYPIKHCCFRYIQMYHQSTYASRELFNRIGGFDEKYSLLADWIWESKAIDSGAKVMFIKDKLSVFNYDGASAKGIIKRDEEWVEWAHETFPILELEDVELFINCLDQGRTPRINFNQLTKVACNYENDQTFIKTYFETLVLVCIDLYEEHAFLFDYGHKDKIILEQLLETSITSSIEKSAELFRQNIDYVISTHDNKINKLLLLNDRNMYKNNIRLCLQGLRQNITGVFANLTHYILSDIRYKHNSIVNLNYMRKRYYAVRSRYVNN